MHILFVHQNYPAQFGHIAARLAKLPGHRCTFVSQKPAAAATVERVQYRLRGGATKHNHTCTRSFENAVHHSLAVYAALRNRPDIRPDLIIGHSGFGSTLYLRELYPDVPILNYFEWFYHTVGGDMDFRPEFPSSTLNRLRARTRNAMILLDLEACAAGYSPTHWQWSRLPPEFQAKVTVNHDGIDTDFWKPVGNAARSPGPRAIGDWTIPTDTKLVTYVSRGFEAMRGFDVFMRVAARLCKQRDDVVFAVVGEDRVCYGGDARFTGGKSFKDWVLSQGEYDLNRIRFLGRLPPSQLARLLGMSDLHMYLTAPFVLSWSLLNAMSCGATVLASDTPPVREVIRDGQTGLLANFHDVDRWVDLANSVLSNPTVHRPLGQAGCELVRERYSVETCLPKLKSLFHAVVNRHPRQVTQLPRDQSPSRPSPLPRRETTRVVPESQSAGSASTVQEFAAPGPKRVLHVGCGPKRRNKLHKLFHGKEWQEVRVDIDPSVTPDVIASITDMGQIPDTSFDAVWSSHNLEHLSAHEVPVALGEFLRVLKPGGFVLVTMPDLQKAAEFLARGRLEEPIYQSPAGPISAIDICFGHRASVARGNSFMAHKTGFSAHTLREKLAASGFVNVRVQRKNLDLWAVGNKPA